MTYDATIEYLSGQRAAIITLTNVSTGEWSGSGRIDLPHGRKADLYEAGYRLATQNARCKGGTIWRYREVR